MRVQMPSLIVAILAVKTVHVLSLEQFWTWEPLDKFDFSSAEPHYDTGVRKQYVCRVKETTARGQNLGFTVGYYEHPPSKPDRNKCFAVGQRDMKFIKEDSSSKIEILSFPPGKAQWIEVKNNEFEKYQTNMIAADEKREKFICRMPTKKTCGKPKDLDEQDLIGRVVPKFHTNCICTNDGEGGVGGPRYEVLVAAE